MDEKKLSPMRVRRFLCGLSLDALAYQTKIDQARLSRIERGWKMPTDRERRKIARALRVEVSEIFPEASDGRS